MGNKAKDVALFRQYAQANNWLFEVQAYNELEIEPRTLEEFQEMKRILSINNLEFVMNNKRLNFLNLLQAQNCKKELAYRYLLQRGIDVEICFDKTNETYYLTVYLEKPSNFLHVSRMVKGFEIEEEFIYYETKQKTQNKEGVVIDMNYKEFLNKVKNLDGVDEVEVISSNELLIYPLDKDVRKAIYYFQKEYQSDKRAKEIYIRYNMTRVTALSEDEFKTKIKEFGAFVRKFGGFVELEDKTNIIAYYKSDKVKKVFEDNFKNYWYTKLNLGGGKTKSLSLTLVPIYPSGTAWTLEEWETLIDNIKKKLERFGIQFNRPTTSTLEILVKNDDQIAYNRNLYNYGDKKLILQDGSQVRTRIEFVKV